ncbi:MAG TPA: hypothetical protein VKA67_04675, partial [Verrucomicrobiae bacterium]|nr:hypothetical protein [Verrucomicrobiae bacterium]
HHGDFFCDSIHSVCPILPSAVLVRPDFGFASSLNLVSPAPSVTLARLEAVIPRQPPDPHWAFTPEVRLGPAFHSLAPPVSSLS